MANIKRLVYWAGAFLPCTLLLVLCFHQSLWFDEAFTVGLVSKSFPELLSIAAADVHPPLYYLLLKAFLIPFGGSLTAARLFSWLPYLLLSCLGAFGLRRHFGRCVALLFNLCLCLLPMTARYAGQLRMYSWAMLFVTFTGYFAWRYRHSSPASRRGRLFLLGYLLCGLMAAYTHYFALIAVGCTALVLAIRCLKPRHERAYRLKPWLLATLLQLLGYLPGFYWVFLQSQKVIQGYWIQVKYPDILAQTVSSVLADRLHPLFLGLSFPAVLAILCLSAKSRQRPQGSLAAAAVWVPLLVLAAGLLISVWRPVFYPRYLYVAMGPLCFSLALSLRDLFSQGGKRRLAAGVALFCLTVCGAANLAKSVQCAVDPQNQLPAQVLSQQLRDEDCILYPTINAAGILWGNFPNTPLYFDARGQLSFQEAYRAFSPQLSCITGIGEMGDTRGRIWIVTTTAQPDFSGYEAQGLTQDGPAREFWVPYSSETIRMAPFRIGTDSLGNREN